MDDNIRRYDLRNNKNLRKIFLEIDDIQNDLKNVAERLQEVIQHSLWKEMDFTRHNPKFDNNINSLRDIRNDLLEFLAFIHKSQEIDEGNGSSYLPEEE